MYDFKLEDNYEMAAKTLAELFLWHLKDLYGAEAQILKALPKMAKQASTPALRDAFETHLKETENQVRRLNKVFESLGMKASAEKCTALEGIVDEAEEVINRAEQGIFQLSENRLGQGFADIPTIVKNSFGSLDELYARGQEITGLATHYTQLDKMTAGFQPSDLIVIAARPSMGKTAFAMNIAENAAVMDGKVVGVFSLEMSKEALLMRMLASHSRVDSHRLRTGFIPREDREKLTFATESLMQARLFIDDTPGISVTEMRSKSRRLKQQEGRLDLLIVDYLQLMSAVPIGGKRFENRTQEVSAISRGLKAVAKELKVPVVALSQLSRAPESRGGDHRPQLSDLRESGSIEQDADVVAFIFREEVYKKDDPDLEGLAEIIVAKQRNGPTGLIKLAFLHSCTRFENRAEQDGYMQ